MYPVKKKISLTLRELAERTNAELGGDDSIAITGINSLESANQSEITFVSDLRKLSNVAGSTAAAVILTKRMENLAKPQLIVTNVDTALITILKIFAPELEPLPAGIHKTAVVEKSAQIDPEASIGPLVYIASDACIGKDTVIGPGCRIGQNTKIGRNCRLDGNVVVYHNCTVGDNVIIQANTTIGSTGFGYAAINGRPQLIPHNGTVIIEDCVEIGANCCVDRAKFGSTIIGAGSKIDNLVQIAHNVVIGKCCLIAGQAGMGGSSTLGDGVILAGSVGIIDHINVGSGVKAGARATIFQNVEAGKQVWGTPAIDAKEAIKAASITKRLPKMAEQLRELARKVERLETAKDNSQRS